MALRQPDQTITTQPAAGRFEAEETTVEQVTPAANDSAASAPTPAAAAANDQLAAPAVPVVQQGGALATSSRAEASAFAKEVEAMKGGADFSYGNYTVFKGNNGEIVSTKDSSLTLGRWAKVTMIAWDDHHEVSPGSKVEKSKDYVAYSQDGVTIKSVIGKDQAHWVGKKVADYVEWLRGDGDYPQAKSARFIDIACVVHETESNDTLAGEIIQVTLSSSSIPSFSQYQEKLLMKAKAVAKGIPGVTVPADPFTFYFLRELASGNGNNWTKLRVLDKLPAKL